jgi:hypothetical protein
MTTARLAGRVAGGSTGTVGPFAPLGQGSPLVRELAAAR